MTSKWEDYLLGNFFLGKFYKKWMKDRQVHINLLTQKEWDLIFKKSGFKVKRKMGYLDRKTSRLIDLFHYVSVSSLTTYKLFGKWVLFGKQYDVLPITNWIYKLTKRKVAKEKAGALFYELA